MHGGQSTALAMIFKLAQAAEKNWRRLDGQNQLPKMIHNVKFNNGIEVVQAAASPTFDDSSQIHRHYKQGDNRP
jgi:hypothetical protein